jgi:hypothetical protein
MASFKGKFTASGPLSFLNDWTYGLGAEIIVPSGRLQLFQSGVHRYYQYGHLYVPGTKIIVRSTTQKRMREVTQPSHMITTRLTPNRAYGTFYQASLVWIGKIKRPSVTESKDSVTQIVGIIPWQATIIVLIRIVSKTKEAEMLRING